MRNAERAGSFANYIYTENINPFRFGSYELGWSVNQGGNAA